MGLLNHNAKVEFNWHNFLKKENWKGKSTPFPPWNPVIYKVTCSNVRENKQLVNLKLNLSMNDSRFQQNTVLPYICRRIQKNYDQLRQHIEEQRHYFANKGPSSQGYGFSSGHAWMRELDCEESWAPKNLCFWTVVLEKTIESPLDCKEIQPVHSEGDQSWIFIGRTNAEAETPNTLATWSEELTHWKRPWCWKRLKVGGQGDDRGWDGWMALPTQWTWVWVSSRSWWWTGKARMLQSMGLANSSTQLSKWTVDCRL